MQLHENLWERSDAEFPSGGTLEEQLRFLIGYATLAPSGHNTQPWLFGTGPDWVDVIADRTRALPIVDPHDRELTISCGAAIGLFEIAARRFSLQTDVALSPDGAFHDHLAQITVSEGQPPSDAEIALFEAILTRRTDRSAYYMEALPDDLDPACRDISEVDGINVRFVESGPIMEAIADLVSKGDQIQFDDPSFRRELAAWVHSFRLGSRDGMSGAGFGVPDILAPAARFVIRTFDLGNNVAAVDKNKILAGSPALVLLTSTADHVDDWLNSGRALARLLLLLTSRGYTASFLNQPIEVDELRPALQDAARATGLPQILLRVGRSERSPAPSARRALSDVIATD